jgi:hypothetical protein
MTSMPTASPAPYPCPSRSEVRPGVLSAGMFQINI